MPVLTFCAPSVEVSLVIILLIIVNYFENAPLSHQYKEWIRNRKVSQKLNQHLIVIRVYVAINSV